MYERNGAMESANEATGELTKVYHIDQFSGTTRVRSPQGTRLTAKLGISCVLEALGEFAPNGHPTILSSTQLSLKNEVTGKIIKFEAHELTEVAKLLEHFAIFKEAPVPPKKEAPLLDEVFDTPAHELHGAPAWILENSDFKPKVIGDDGSIVLDFCPLEMKSKYVVNGKAEPDKANAWGYAVNLGNRAFGWAVLIDPETVLVTGIEGKKHSKHRTLLSALFRLSSHLQDLMEKD